ncbi:hypothetical protein [Bradyrhizobium sp.]|uniref:hypothetical protein n=1 Tax=Bradyrhizobium sp. TaxID=376 RepID=UPI00262C82F2|nr:hypothetical protein [Bradyrhizobium sp.]
MTDEMIQEIVRLAGNFAVTVAGIPTPMVMESLLQFADTLRDEFVEAVGAEAAEMISISFTRTVLKCKQQIEGSNCQGATLQ